MSMVNKINNSHDVLVDMVEMVEELGVLSPDVYADLLVCIDEHKKLTKVKEPVRKEYLYNFKEGGWNSVYAFNKEEAIKSAEEEWKDSKNLTVDVDSVRRPAKGETEQLMSLFH